MLEEDVLEVTADKGEEKWVEKTSFYAEEGQEFRAVNNGEKGVRSGLEI